MDRWNVSSGLESTREEVPGQTGHSGFKEKALQELPGFNNVLSL